MKSPFKPRSRFRTTLTSIRATLLALALGALTGGSGCIDFIRDRSPPAPVSALSDGEAWPSLTSSPLLRWTYPGTGNSHALDRFEFALGTTPGETDLKDWQSAGTATQAPSLGGLNLDPTKTYYAAVRAIDSAGQVSSVTLSAGWRPVSSVNVNARFAIAPNWNDYVNAASPSTPCAGTETGYYSCLHGGEKRELEYAGASNCTGLSATDELAAFDWTCAVGGAGVVFRSRGLKDSKGLADLLEPAAWKENRVILRRDGQPIASSLPARWWTNPVLPLPANPVGPYATLSTAGAIYTLESSRTSAGYLIGADRIGIVTLPGAVLSYQSDNSEWCGIATSPALCLIHVAASQDPKFTWLEGKMISPEIATNAFLLYYQAGAFPVFRRLSTWGGPLLMQQSVRSARLDQVQITSMFGSILKFRNTLGTRIQASATTLMRGLQLDVDTSYFREVLATGGVELSFSDNSVFFGLTGNQDGGNHAKVTISHTLGSAYFSNCSDLTIAQGAHYAVTLANVARGKLTGNLLLSTPEACEALGGTDPGVGASCTPQGASDFNRVGGVDTLNSFFGPIYRDDSKNASDTLGEAPYVSIADWLNFETPFRGWTDSQNRLCSAGSCRIFDWRLKALDMVLRNTTGTGNTQNDAFIPGAPCPAAAHGNVTTQDLAGRLFLRNAFEILGDEIGDEDGLCESNEACVYAPNFGAYQGEGDYTAPGACAFQDGTISGVTLYAYPINGAS